MDQTPPRPSARPLTIVVLGASGDLAQKKIFPALFALYGQQHLPADCRFIGYARTEMDDQAFRERIAGNLTCRYIPAESCGSWTARFLARCFYVAGRYDATEPFRQLGRRLAEIEDGRPSDRLFYFALPPAVFPAAAAALGAAGLAAESETPAAPWVRVVLEKPFGRDRASSDALTERIHEVFHSRQIYRIDHYLGKTVIQNLMVLRFANLVFEPIWNRDHVAHVRIVWKEDIGIGGRAGYFDDYGILRDVLQNHLLQMLALVAMEPPVRIEAPFVIEEKVKVLRSVLPIRPEDAVFGQYQGRTVGHTRLPAYREESGVPPDSRTPTFAAAVLNIRNRRWDGVPFFLSAGKALDGRAAEIRVRFKQVPGGLFCVERNCLPPNELVIRVQPDEAILLNVVTMAPGLSVKLAPAQLDLRYAQAFDAQIPDAYECLLLEVLKGDKSLFISAAELAASWDIVTPLLAETDQRRLEPEPYAFGSRGPSGAARLAARFGLAEDGDESRPVP
jgi:glucose-6-phosphate 1-dehydrogenase